MRSLIGTIILLGIAVFSINYVQASPGQSTLGLLYSSYTDGINTRSVSIRGIAEGIDDIAGTFLDNNQNGTVDGVLLESFGPNGPPNGPIGSMSFGFNIVTVDGVRLLSFPVTNSNNFLVPSDLLDSFPDEAIEPMVPITDDNRFELSIADGTPILAFDLMVEAGDDDGGNGNGNPPDFEINLGLAGAWFNPATPGQGFLIDLLSDEQFIFITWYTFTPDGQQQWFTAAGNFQGNRVELEVIEATGGVFNEPSEVTREVSGSVIAEFTDCLNGTIEFDIAEFGLTGVIPITRIAGDQICQDLIDGNLVLP